MCTSSLSTLHRQNAKIVIKRTKTKLSCLHTNNKKPCQYLQLIWETPLLLQSILPLQKRTETKVPLHSRIELRTSESFITNGMVCRLGHLTDCWGEEVLDENIEATGRKQVREEGDVKVGWLSGLHSQSTSYLSI